MCSRFESLKDNQLMVKMGTGHATMQSKITVFGQAKRVNGCWW